MIEIIPAIMPKSIRDLESSLQEVVRYVKTIQIDVMDGNFVKSKSWPYAGQGWNSFEKILSQEEGFPLWDSLDFEIDLMVSKPEEVIADWIAAGASRIVVHSESTENMNEIIKNSEAIELGIALNIDTGTDLILPYLEDIKFVQFMGIDKIGYQGQMFDERVIDKIRDFHNSHPEIIVSVDGGVNLETAGDLLEAGARRLIVGSAIFESENIGETINRFKAILYL